MIEQQRDLWAWAVMAGDVLYAQRPTRDEAEQVAREQYDLARHFGLPVLVVPPTISPLTKSADGASTMVRDGEA